MSRPEFDPNAPVDPIDDIVYRGLHPDDLIDLYSGREVLPEAGTFAPRHIGSMAESVRGVPVIVTSHPRGVHMLLCRLGFHAWQYRSQRVGYTTQWLRRRCAVCGVLRG